jgi:hypothetical protein
MARPDEIAWVQDIVMTTSIRVLAQSHLRTFALPCPRGHASNPRWRTGTSPMNGQKRTCRHRRSGGHD